MKVYLFFPRFKDEHLAKDVFLLPYSIARELNSDLNVCYDFNKNKVDFNNVEELKIIEHNLSLNGKSQTSLISLFKQITFLFKESKKIDLLILFHYRWYSLLLCFLYKKINKEGTVYIKSDMPIGEAENNFGKKRKVFKRFFYSFFTKYVSVVSFEVSEVIEFIKKTWLFPFIQEKILFLPNGFKPLPNKKNNKKEDIFLTVGRLGTHQKNTELILDSLELVDLKDWSFYFIGELTGEINSYTKQLLLKKPELERKLNFIGYLSDLEKKNEYYNLSKVFVLSSRYESYGLVLLEAAAAQCYLLSTNVGAMNDLINIFGCSGETFSPDKYTLSKKIQSIVDGNITRVSNNIDYLEIDNLTIVLLRKIYGSKFNQIK